MPTLFRTFVLAVAASALAGCSAAPRGDLRLISAGSGQAFAQSFPAGSADVRDAGDADVVVACRTDAAAGKGAPAVRQVLHVRVLWQQGYQVKAAQQEVSRNALLNWYVYPAGSTDSAGGQGVVEYTGTGLVEMDRSGDTVTVRVREASLRPTTTVTGRMADPLGPTMLTGTIVARQDRPAAAALLTDLRATVAAAKQAGPGRGDAAAAEARVPVGP